MSVKHIEWLNTNGVRAYPLKEDVTRLDLLQSFTIPNSFIVDLVIIVDNGRDKKFYVQQVINLPSAITVIIADEDDVSAGSFVVTASSHTENKFYPIAGIGDYQFLQGKVVIGDLAEMQAAGVGTFIFDIGAGEIEPCTVIPNIRGVTSVGVKRDENTTEPVLTDNVKFAEGTNFAITVDSTNNAIRFDAIEGEGLGPECLCPEVEPPGLCAKFLNGIPVDSNNNFNVQGVGCISVTPIENGIKIDNTCVEPCCDCDDLQDIETKITALQNDINALVVRVQTLENCP